MFLRYWTIPYIAIEDRVLVTLYNLGIVLILGLLGYNLFIERAYFEVDRVAGHARLRLRTPADWRPLELMEELKEGRSEDSDSRGYPRSVMRHCGGGNGNNSKHLNSTSASSGDDFEEEEDPEEAATASSRCIALDSDEVSNSPTPDTLFIATRIKEVVEKALCIRGAGNGQGGNGQNRASLSKDSKEEDNQGTSKVESSKFGVGGTSTATSKDDGFSQARSSSGSESSSSDSDTPHLEAAPTDAFTGLPLKLLGTHYTRPMCGQFKRVTVSNHYPVALENFRLSVVANAEAVNFCNELKAQRLRCPYIYSTKLDNLKRERRRKRKEMRGKYGPVTKEGTLEKNETKKEHVDLSSVDGNPTDDYGADSSNDGTSKSTSAAGSQNSESGGFLGNAYAFVSGQISSLLGMKIGGEGNLNAAQNPNQNNHNSTYTPQYSAPTLGEFLEDSLDRCTTFSATLTGWCVHHLLRAWHSLAHYLLLHTGIDLFSVSEIATYLKTITH